MSRKPLDLSVLEAALEKKTKSPIDRDTQRAMLMSSHLTDGADKFSVVQEDDKEVLIRNGSSLPSDEEIKKMKQELKEQDKIESMKVFNELPWWKKILVKAGFIDGHSA